MQNIEEIIKDAKLNDTDKQVELARIYLEKKMYEDAFSWYKRAANLGNADGINGLGYCYLYGKGVEVDSARAKELFHEAANQGSGLALMNLGLVFYKDRKLEYLIEASNLGEINAIYALGQHYMNMQYSSSINNACNRDTCKAFEYFFRAAKKGHAKSQYEIGLFYESGIDPCIRNTEKAADWFSKSAEQGYPLALFALGRIYANGVDDCTPDYVTAYSYFVRAADMGIVDAQYRVGMSLLYGSGVNPNKELAYRYFLKAANQGHSDSICQVALALFTGCGTERNEKKAIEWLNSPLGDPLKQSIFLSQMLKDKEDQKRTGNLPYGLVNANIDSYGVMYSIDRRKLLRYSIDDDYRSLNYGLMKQQFLTDYEIPYGVEVISDNAFEGCESLQHIHLPNTIREIGTGAFRNCVNLESINIPEGIGSLLPFSFDGCLALGTLCLPKTLIEIGVGAIRGVRHVVSKSNKFVVKDNCLLSSDSKSLIHFMDGGSDTFRIPIGIEVIKEYAFSGCYLSKIEIPSSVKYIEDSAFANCKFLEAVEFEDGNMRAIGAAAFYGCELIKKIVLPNGLKRIGVQAFSRCEKLKDVVFPDTIQEIGNLAFEATSLSKVILPRSLKTLGVRAFADSNLDTLKSESPLFMVKEMTIYDKSGTIILQYYGGSESLEIPVGVKEIGDYAFHSADNLKELIIPNTVIAFGKHENLPKRITVSAFTYEVLKKSIGNLYHDRIVVK